MTYKNEEYILKIIKFTPPIFTLTISILFTIFLYNENRRSFLQEKSNIEKRHIKQNKKRIKDQVLRIKDYIVRSQNDIEESLKRSLKNRVNEAHAIATNIYIQNKHQPKQVIKKMIQDALVDIRFNNKRGYFFIYSLDYECILLPVARHLEGTSFYNFKEGTGRYLTREIVSLMKKEPSGFLTWSYHKPSDMHKQYKKLGFNKYFEPLDWFIGTGEYIDDFKKDVQADILKTINRLEYANEGYIFIFDQEGTYLSHADKTLLGQNLLKISHHPQINVLFNSMKNIANTSSDYFEYIHYDKPNANKQPLAKISYITGLDSWIIGTGFYKNEAMEQILRAKKLLDDQFNQNIINLILINIILTIILLIISIQFSRKLRRRFYLYKKEINNYMARNKIQHDMMAQQSKMAAMGEMIGNIAHQWRQPLCAISAAATGMKLQKDYGSLQSEDIDKAVEGINDAAQYLSHTIDDFRNYFQVNKEKTLFGIEDIINEATKLTSTQFIHHNIVVIKSYENVQLFSLKNELIQVFLNILNNCKDQFQIQKKLKKRFVFISTSIEKDLLVITIKDNAGGFKEEIIARVFEPYFTTKHKSQGTGIGLFMTEEIIRKHLEGTIKASNETYTYHSKNYTGACITIKLPLAKNHKKLNS
jgi:signal transduction histidine kinase